MNYQLIFFEKRTMILLRLITAIENMLYAVLPFTGLFIADIKIAESERHRGLTKELLLYNKNCTRSVI